MKLILAGCEYSGTTTIANALYDWAERALGANFRIIHDHWKIPHTSGHSPTDEVHFLTEEEYQQVLALSPKLKEMTQRHSLVYHTPYEPTDSDLLLIGYVFDEAVYAPLYFGYGGPGGAGDRSMYARHLEHRFLKAAPETVLVHVKASAQVIAQRMNENPHPNGVLREKDIDYVLKRFEEEVWKSLILRRITLDTSAATVDETFKEFLRQMAPHFTEKDRLALLTYQRLMGADCGSG
jgi:hypothetical protein